MPGYEPFLLCDFHVHTRWSDGRLSLREVIDLYGRTRRFDVIAITDHILMRRDFLARAGRLISLGRREFSVTSLKHYPYVANSDFHKPKHLYSWKTLLRCKKTWEDVARALRSNVDVALTLYRNGSWAA